MFVNGKEMNFENELTISNLLKTLNLNENKVVLEVNMKIVPKENYSTHVLNKEDRIEIISLVGGG